MNDVPLIVRGMHGLGDNLYQLPLIRELAGRRSLFMVTPWPQLYEHINILCIKPDTRLRTQRKNVLATRDGWAQPPRKAQQLVLSYQPHQGVSITEALERALGLGRTRPVFTAPAFRSPIVGKYVVVRPSTVRREWPAQSRNPHGAYIRMAVERLREAGHKVVSVAALQDGEEWLDGEAYEADVTFHRGELSVKLLLGLFAHAQAAVGGIGWIAPAAVMYGTPTLLLYGGWGAYNNPRRLFDPRMATAHITQLVPEPLCMCRQNDHKCNKSIANVEERIDAWIKSLPSP